MKYRYVLATYDLAKSVAESFDMMFREGWRVHTIEWHQQGDISFAQVLWEQTVPSAPASHGCREGTYHYHSYDGPH